MPPLGSTKKAERECLVCGALTSTAHMGIDVCRACTVFYRRSLGKKPYVCRSSTNRCLTGKGLNCKKCRLQSLEAILKQSSANDQATIALSPIEKAVDTDTIMNHMQPSTSSSSPCSVNSVNDDARPRPLLSRVRTAYEKMSFARLMGELFSRKVPPSPIQISSKNHPTYPATFASMNHANRLLLTCIMEFATCSFPDFESLSNEDKWSLAVKFFYTFRMFENSYRASKMFVDMPNRSFGSYTLWLSDDIVEKFFDDYDDEKGDVAEAKKIMADNCSTKPALGRRIVERVNPDEEEFIAVLTLITFGAYTLFLSEDILECFFDDFNGENGDVEEAKKIMADVCRAKSKRGRAILGKMVPDEQEFLALLPLLFWAPNGLEASDEFTRISESYQQRISSELHVYYRDILQLDDYASRMGELFSSLQMYENHEKIKETFQMFRLLNIFSDDSFTYKLTKP